MAKMVYVIKIATGTPLWAEGIIKCASDYKKRKSGVNISLNQVL
jgi:hypothetical protein